MMPVAKSTQNRRIETQRSCNIIDRLAVGSLAISIENKHITEEDLRYDNTVHVLAFDGIVLTIQSNGSDSEQLRQVSNKLSKA